MKRVNAYLLSGVPGTWKTLCECNNYYSWSWLPGESASCSWPSLLLAGSGLNEQGAASIFRVQPPCTQDRSKDTSHQYLNNERLIHTLWLTLVMQGRTPT